MCCPHCKFNISDQLSVQQVLEIKHFALVLKNRHSKRSCENRIEICNYRQPGGIYKGQYLFAQSQFYGVIQATY